MCLGMLPDIYGLWVRRFQLFDALNLFCKSSGSILVFLFLNLLTRKSAIEEISEKPWNSSISEFLPLWIYIPQLTKPLTWFLWSHWLWMFPLLNCSLGANKIPNLHYSTTRDVTTLWFISVNTNEDIAFFGRLARCEDTVIIWNPLGFGYSLLVIRKVNKPLNCFF